MFALLLHFTIILIATSCSVPYCSACTDSFCYQCTTNYQLYNGYCVGSACLDSNCVTCDYSQFWCIQCSPMYQLKGGVCTIATYVIVAPIIIFIIGFVMCVFYCAMRIHRRKLRRKALEQLYQQQRISVPPVPTSDLLLDNPDFYFEYEEDKGFCSICLEGNSNLITQCGHYFHVDCFGSWVRRHKICPICNNKDMELVIVMLCMKCKKRYYHYETFINFLLKVKADMDRPCAYCLKHPPNQTKQKVSLDQAINSQQLILPPAITTAQENE